MAQLTCGACYQDFSTADEVMSHPCPGHATDRKRQQWEEEQTKEKQKKGKKK